MEETNSEVQSTNNKKIYKIIGLIVLLIYFLDVCLIKIILF